MVQIAAALLFALAAGLGLTVIWAMLKGNGEAILSALAGEGAFPLATGPSPSPAPQIVSVRRIASRSASPRAGRFASAPRPLLNRAA